MRAWQIRSNIRRSWKKICQELKKEKQKRLCFEHSLFCLRKANHDSLYVLQRNKSNDHSLSFKAS